MLNPFGLTRAFKLLKPNLDGDDGLTFISPALFVSGKFSVGESMKLVVELTIAHGKFDRSGFSSDSETMLGNLYGGLEIRRAGSSSFAELGVRLPTAPDDKFIATTVGFNADFDRLEAFIPDALTILGKINFQSMNSSNVGFRIRFGPTLFLNSTNFSDEKELFLDYSGQIVYGGQQVTVMAGVTGRLIVTEEELNFGERSFHQLGGSVILTSGNVQPGVHIRFPMDDNLSNIIDYIFGLNVTVNLQ